MYPRFKLCRKGVYNWCSNSMKTSWNFIAPTSKFSSSMKYCQDSLKCWFSSFWMYFCRDTTPIVLYCTTSIFSESDGNQVTVTCHRFINRVINDLPNKMMESSFISGTDIHSRSFSYGFESLKDLDTTCIIVLFIFSHRFFVNDKFNVLILAKIKRKASKDVVWNTRVIDFYKLYFKINYIYWIHTALF